MVIVTKSKATDSETAEFSQLGQAPKRDEPRIVFFNKAAATLANEPVEQLSLEQLKVWDLLNRRIFYDRAGDNINIEGEH